MQVETDETEVIERVAALDVGKAEVVCCARVPGPGGQRMQEVRTISTMTAAVLALGDWLAGLGVTRVVMEATSDYWRGPGVLVGDRGGTGGGRRPVGEDPPGPAQDGRPGGGRAGRGRAGPEAG